MFTNKESHSPEVSARRQKPSTLYGRLFSPDAASHVLLTKAKDGKLTATQFLDENNPLYRPVVLKPIESDQGKGKQKQKENEKPKQKHSEKENERERETAKPKKKSAPKKDAKEKQEKTQRKGLSDITNTVSNRDTNRGPKQDPNSRRQSLSKAESLPKPDPHPFLSPSGKRKRLPFKANTPGGTELESKRSVEILQKESDGTELSATLFFLSPTRPAAANATTAPQHKPRTQLEVPLDLEELLQKPIGAQSVQSAQSSQAQSLGTAATTPIPNPKKRKACCRALIPPVTPTTSAATHSASPSKSGATDMDTSDSDTSSDTYKNGNNSDDNSIEGEIKGGEEVLLSAFKRARKGVSSQKTVMKRTAQEALFQAIQENKHKYDEQTLQLLVSLVNNFAIEWLHCLAFSLAPFEINPQESCNLGAGPKWINTNMTVLEKTAQYFKDHFQGAVTVTPTFNMLGDTDVIQDISYVVKIMKNGYEVEISDRIKALALPDRSNWPSATDTPQTIRVINGLFGMDPSIKRVSTTFSL